MRDPFFHTDKHLDQLGADDAVRRVARRVFILKLLSGLTALAILAAILVTWRVG